MNFRLFATAVTLLFVVAAFPSFSIAQDTSLLVDEDAECGAGSGTGTGILPIPGTGEYAICYADDIPSADIDDVIEAVEAFIEAECGSTDPTACIPGVPIPSPEDLCEFGDEPRRDFPDCLTGDPYDEVVPGQITDLATSYVGINAFTVGWTAPADEDIDHYNLYWNATNPVTNDNKAASTVISVAADQTEHAFTGLDPATVRFLAIAAVDGGENPEGGVNEAPLSNGIRVQTLNAGITLTPPSFSILENARKVTYTVNTNDIPEDLKKVAIDIEVIDNNEILVEPIQIDLERVEIDDSNHAKGLTVNITIIDDDFGLGDRTYLIRHTVDVAKVGRDQRYDIAPVADLVVRILEDEVEPAINLLDETGITLLEGADDGSENGHFQVKLSRKPTDDVFVHLVSNNETNVRLTTPHFLRFGASDWDVYQQVNFTAPDNDHVDGPRPTAIHVAIEDSSASEYVDRAPMRQVVVTILDDEIDVDNDGLLDADDRKADDPHNKDVRPRNFQHQFSTDGNTIRFTWTAVRDDRISHYVLWEFSDPTNVAEVQAVEGQREYALDYAYDGGVHKYALQPILHSHPGAFGDVPYDEEVYDEAFAVQLGQLVFSQQYYNQVCGISSGTNGTANVTDLDGDGVCDEFEDLVGTDKTQADTDGDGKDDHEELFGDGTDPLDPDSRATLVPSWGRDPWVITGSILLMASIVVVILSLVKYAAVSRQEDAVSS